MPKCISIWGHKFGARYSYAYPEGIGPITTPAARFSGASIEFAETMLRAGQVKTYHGDVCERCGVIVNAQRPTCPASDVVPGDHS